MTFLAIISVTVSASKSPFKAPKAVSMRGVLRAAVAPLIVSSLIGQTFPQFNYNTAYAAESEIAAVVDSTVVDIPAEPILTAAELLKRDVQPKKDLLQDVQFIIRLLPSYVDAADYPALRQALRDGPVTELRKTCRKLVSAFPSFYFA